MVLVEIGGTVGDIESLPFLEAIRQFRQDAGREHTLYIHLTLVPFIGAAGELKTKPTQHSVRDLRSIGIQPDILLCRTDRFLDADLKKKIALFCDVDPEAVITAKSVYDDLRNPSCASPPVTWRNALDGLIARFPGRVEEHSPWNTTREASLVLRGDLPLAEAEEFLVETGLGWATFLDNGIPRRYESMPEVERVHAYHLVPKGVSKAAAIAADREHRGLAKEDCAMVGDSAADVECAPEVARCFLVRNGYDKDPGLAWTGKPDSGVEVTRAAHGSGFAEAVHRLLDGAETLKSRAVMCREVRYLLVTARVEAADGFW